MDSQPTILSFVKSPPNLCSLAGFTCTMAAIYFIILGLYPFAMICMIWAVALDWSDGLLARKMVGRSGTDRAFGGQLDILIDIVSYGVTPAILLLRYGNFSPVFLFGSFLILTASALRLSYFSTFGLSGGSHYVGLALDNNSLLLVFVFLFEGVFSGEVFSYILYASCLILALLNVSPIKTPKLSGNPLNVYALALYTLLVTCFYIFQIL